MAGTVGVVSVDELNLSDVRNAGELLARTPNGGQVASIAEALGLLHSGTLTTPQERRAFVKNVSNLSPAKLSDEQSYWASEFGRIVELIGLLSGQEQYLALAAKAARARARARVARAEEEAAETKVEEGEEGAKKRVRKTLTSTQISDQAESDPAVLDADERLAVVRLLLEPAKAAKEATTMYLTTLSREISFRCSQMDARIY